jgi:hypothetical protein
MGVAWGNLRRRRSSDVPACIDFVAAPQDLSHGARDAGSSAFSDRLLALGLQPRGEALEDLGFDEHAQEVRVQCTIRHLGLKDGQRPFW